MYMGWAIKSSPCTATFNNLLFKHKYKKKSNYTHVMGKKCEIGYEPHSETVSVPKLRRKLYTRLHGITSQKTLLFFIVNGVINLSRQKLRSLMDE
jgi:hypothetical protein